MQKEEIRFENSTVLEGMTSISALFAAKEAGLNDRGIERILFDRTKKQKKERELRFLSAKCREYGIELVLRFHSCLTLIAQVPLHRPHASPPQRRKPPQKRLSLPAGGDRGSLQFRLFPALALRGRL